MYSGKQLKDDRECLKVDKFEPNQAELGGKKKQNTFVWKNTRRRYMETVTYAWVCTHTHAYHSSIRSGCDPMSVSRDPPMVFRVLTHC